MKRACGWIVDANFDSNGPEGPPPSNPARLARLRFQTAAALAHAVGVRASPTASRPTRRTPGLPVGEVV